MTGKGGGRSGDWSDWGMGWGWGGLEGVRHREGFGHSNGNICFLGLFPKYIFFLAYFISNLHLHEVDSK